MKKQAKKEGRSAGGKLVAKGNTTVDAHSQKITESSHDTRNDFHESAASWCDNYTGQARFPIPNPNPSMMTATVTPQRQCQAHLELTRGLRFPSRALTSYNPNPDPNPNTLRRKKSTTLLIRNDEDKIHHQPNTLTLIVLIMFSFCLGVANLISFPVPRGIRGDYPERRKEVLASPKPRRVPGSLVHQKRALY